MQFDIVAMADYSGALAESAQKTHICLTAFSRADQKISITSLITRSDLRQQIEQLLLSATKENQIALIGFDHNFGFPLGFAEHLISNNKSGWYNHYSKLIEKTRLIELGPRAWADSINRSFSRLNSGPGPFWGPNFNPVRRPDFAFDQHKISTRRLVEERCPRMKSIFQLGGAGSVGLQSLYGMIHLLRVIGFCRNKQIPVHVWPFDGWTIPRNKHVLIEIYPALYNSGIKSDMEDALSSLNWFRQQIDTGTIDGSFQPRLNSTERKRAFLEGWVPGIQ